MNDNSAGILEAIALFTFGIILVRYLVKPSIQKHLEKKRSFSFVEKEMLKNWQFYDELLCTNNCFYRNLDIEKRTKFVSRLLHFQFTKSFQYISIDPQPEIRVLISAAAIQLTFGLEHYLLDFFRKIYVIGSDYYYGLNQEIYQGHVNTNGIYLSWNNFLQGYRYCDDAQNVGLHEMAHALAYTNFVAQEDMDYDFVKRFHSFSKTARPIFNRLQKQNDTFLDNYATTNYNEFWAVCIETFFEKPEQLHSELPELYNALSYVLNQDLLLQKNKNNPSDLIHA